MSQSQDPNEGMLVINYITDQMNRDAASQDTARIKSLNAFSAVECIAEWQSHRLIYRILMSNMPRQCVDQEMSAATAALISWGLLVRQNGPWDHKPYIRRTFHPRGPGEQVWHRLGNFEYYYDIWSNMHYGYVGRACGFSRDALLDGAGLEQVGSDVLRRRMPEHQPNVPGVAGFDDPSDRLAIQIGMALFASTPSGLTAMQVRASVESANGLDKRPVALQSQGAHQ